MKSLSTKQPAKDLTQQEQHRRSLQSAQEGRSLLPTPLSTKTPLIQRQCACGGSCPRCQEKLDIQTKLKISEPGDEYEQEADRIADEVMRMPEPSVQRQVEGEEEEADEEIVQMKAIGQFNRTASQASTAGSDLEADIQTLRQHGGQSLPTSIRAFMEPRFGQDFSNVRIHTGSQATQISQNLNAGAFTIGNNIFLDVQRTNLESNSGLKLLAHELVHTIQQSNVRSTHSPAEGVIQRGDPEDTQSSAGEEPEDFFQSLDNLPLQQIGMMMIGKSLGIPLGETFIVTTAITVVAKQKFIDLVRKIQRQKGSSINEMDEMALKGILSILPSSAVKELEKELLLWTKFGQIQKMTRIIEIITAFTRKSDLEESQRGRFSENEGEKIKDELWQETENFGYNECLKFLHNASLDILYADEEEEVDTAKSEYAKGAAERRKKTITHARTLSRLASELRLQGLVGPVNILKWKGKGDKGHHDPHPADLFDRLSSAGDGWYFFLASVISYHTFVIAVHVSSGGSNRKYFEIQGGQALQKSREEIKAWFDDEFSNSKGAYSRVWQVYLQPTD